MFDGLWENGSILQAVAGLLGGLISGWIAIGLWRAQVRKEDQQKERETVARRYGIRRLQVSAYEMWQSDIDDLRLHLESIVRSRPSGAELENAQEFKSLRDKCRAVLRSHPCQFPDTLRLTLDTVGLFDQDELNALARSERVGRVVSSEVADLSDSLQVIDDYEGFVDQLNEFEEMLKPCSEHAATAKALIINAQQLSARLPAI